MRLFTAIDLPDDVIDRLEATARRLRSLADIRWSPVSNLHITTRFIGEWKEEQLSDLNAALSQLTNRDPIPIHVHGFGFYPNKRSPNIFWAGVEMTAMLSDLARDTDAAMARLGIQPETRAYSPHLTLARIKGPADLKPLLQELDRLGQPEFGAYPTDRFYLYLSKPGSGGSVYTKLSEFPFLRK